jgi:hypothetical protein
MGVEVVYRPTVYSAKAVEYMIESASNLVADLRGGGFGPVEAYLQNMLGGMRGHGRDFCALADANNLGRHLDELSGAVEDTFLLIVIHLYKGNTVRLGLVQDGES